MSMHISGMRWMHRIITDISGAAEQLVYEKTPCLQMRVSDDNGNSEWADVPVMREEVQT